MHNLMLCDIHAKLLMIFLVRFIVVWEIGSVGVVRPCFPNFIRSTVIRPIFGNDFRSKLNAAAHCNKFNFVCHKNCFESVKMNGGALSWDECWRIISKRK